MVDRSRQQFGNYRLVRLLGKGGFAEVYLGEHLYIKRQAAVKLLRTTLEENGKRNSWSRHNAWLTWLIPILSAFLISRLRTEFRIS